MAWPFIVANASVPLLGIVDTAVIGNTGSVVDLGAIALGALIFSFVYWSFGFLRMGTTGFIARADGAGDKTEVRAIFGRSCLIAVAVGLLMLILQWPIGLLSCQVLSGDASGEAAAAGDALGTGTAMRNLVTAYCARCPLRPKSKICILMYQPRPARTPHSLNSPAHTGMF